MPQDRPDLETSVAVAAHSLLQSVSVILAAAEMVQTHGPTLGPERTDQLLELIGAQGRHVAGVLADLVRGVSPEIMSVLDEMRPPPPLPVDSLGLVAKPVSWE